MGPVIFQIYISRCTFGTVPPVLCWCTIKSTKTKTCTPKTYLCTHRINLWLYSMLQLSGVAYFKDRLQNGFWMQILDLQCLTLDSIINVCVLLLQRLMVSIHPTRLVVVTLTATPPVLFKWRTLVSSTRRLPTLASPTPRFSLESTGPCLDPRPQYRSKFRTQNYSSHIYPQLRLSIRGKRTTPYCTPHTVWNGISRIGFETPCLVEYRSHYTIDWLVCVQKVFGSNYFCSLWQIAMVLLHFIIIWHRYYPLLYPSHTKFEIEYQGFPFTLE